MGWGYKINKYCPDFLLETLSPLFWYYIKNKKIYRDYWHWFDLTDSWSREELIDYQWNATKKLLRFASEKVPYYKEKWKTEGVDVEAINSYEDMTKLPVLTKKDIKNNGEKLLADGVNKKDLIVHRTGGTTGTPLEFYYDMPTELARSASMRRWEKYAGMHNITERLFFMGRPSFDLMNDKSKWGNSGEKYFGDYFPLSKRGRLATTNLADTVLEKYCDLIEKHRPQFLKGYSSGLYLLAEYALRNNRQFDFIKSVMASSDMVTSKQREVTEKAWGCEVFDRYGMGEEIATAAECQEHNGYHIDMVKCMVEIIDDKNNQVFEEPGRLIGTNLNNYAMPLIRYEVGDIASISKKKCKCGIPSLMLNSLDGRSGSVIVTPEGKSITSGVIGLMVIDLEGIVELQLLYKKAGRVIVKIVKDLNYNETTEKLFLERLHSLFDKSVDISLKYTERIPREPNGKFRFIIIED